MDNASVWRARGPEIKSHYGQEFFILKFSIVSRAAQRDNAIANEINCDIHLANTLFSLGNSMYLLVHMCFNIEGVLCDQQPIESILLLMNCFSPVRTPGV